MSEKSFCDLSDTITEVSNGIVDAINSIDVADCNESLGSLEQKISDNNDLVMGEQMKDFTERIERAIAEKNRMSRKIDKIVDAIISHGEADISEVDQRISNRLRRNYPVCCRFQFNDDFSSSECDKEHPLTVFANQELFELHRRKNAQLNIFAEEQNKKRKFELTQPEEISE